jgi:dTDP-glucose 4,6-dehydratase
LDNIPLPLYGDGQNVRDWLYVTDNCIGIDLVLHKGKIGEIYNIGAGNEETNITITNIILEVLKKPDDLIKYVPDRPGHDRRYSVDIAKVKNLGWKPQMDFYQAMEKTIQWYIQNKSWWRKIKEKQEEYQRFYKKQYG